MLNDDLKTVLLRHWSAWAYYAIGFAALIPEVLVYAGANVEMPAWVFFALAVVGLGAKAIKQKLPEASDADQ